MCSEYPFDVAFLVGREESAITGVASEGAGPDVELTMRKWMLSRVSVGVPTVVLTGPIEEIDVVKRKDIHSNSAA